MLKYPFHRQTLVNQKAADQQREDNLPPQACPPPAPLARKRAPPVHAATSARMRRHAPHTHHTPHAPPDLPGNSVCVPLPYPSLPPSLPPSPPSRALQPAHTAARTCRRPTRRRCLRAPPLPEHSTTCCPPPMRQVLDVDSDHSENGPIANAREIQCEYWKLKTFSLFISI